jgi:isopentenyl-diphosphate delta-isomerase
MERENVILVDASDNEVGHEEKLKAHQRGALHRAFSVMIWDSKGRMLLQQRQAGKYHSGGLWSNACCGHPRPGEQSGAAAARRLNEEMGIPCGLTPIGTFSYRAELDAGLIENEFVHLFRGVYDGAIAPDPNECDDFIWLEQDALLSRMAAQPDTFSAWFKKYAAAGWPIAPPAEALP